MIPGFDAFRARLLALLVERGPRGVTTDEMSDPAIAGHEGPRRLRELRALGHPIQAEPLRSGYWRYWLGPAPPDPQQRLVWESDPFGDDDQGALPFD